MICRKCVVAQMSYCANILCASVSLRKFLVAQMSFCDYNLLRKCLVAQISCCANILFRKCFLAQISCCASILLRKCRVAQISCCASILLHNYLVAQVSRCANVSLRECLLAQMSSCANKSLHKCHAHKIDDFCISYFDNFCPMIQKNVVHLVHVFRWRVGRIRRTVKKFPKSFIQPVSFNFHPRNIHQEHQIFCVTRSKNFIVPF